MQQEPALILRLLFLDKYYFFIPMRLLFTFLFLATATLFAACGENKKTPVNDASKYTGEKLEYYGNGKLQRRVKFVNGKKEGQMTDYYPSGEVMAERFFKNDIQVDQTRLFHKSGAVQEVQYYQNGLKQGGDTVFYENGKTQFALEFAEGKKHGYLRKWAETGELTYEAKYEKDSLVEVKGEKIKPIN